MKAVIPSYSHQINTNKSNKLLSKDCKLKKIISVIIYLNKEFEKNIMNQYTEFILTLKN